MRTRRLVALFGLLAVVASLLVAAAAPSPVAATSGAGGSPITGTAVDYALSPAARDVAQQPAATGTAKSPARNNPLGASQPRDPAAAPTDPLAATGAGAGHTPSLDFNFAGVGNPTGCGGCSPPDTVGDVGPNHYVQMVNATKVAVFNKAGALLAPAFNLGTLWGTGTCAANAGDPVVLYDGISDRWLLSQFNGSASMCFAVSQTADPLGAYHLYTFNVGQFPDYFKLGVWPNAYYMSANESTYTAYAFDRSKMIVGDPSASFVKFTGQTNFLMPADLDGPTLPPAGSPGVFYTFKDNSFHGGVDRLEVFELAPSFAGGSTFNLVATIPIASYTYTVCGFFVFDCVRQQGTTRRIDTVSEWPMQRFPYRNFGDHQTLVGNFTVGGGLGEEGAAIRWFELRKTGGGWTLFQEGTHDPGDGHDRFMGSIAMDAAGDIALGYSVSSSTMFPAIRYATRLATDPLGTLQAESVLINGGGSQTGSNRWGDYSAMSVDPADDCSFWYTNEYYPVTASTNWQTRIGKFNLCGGPPPGGPDLSVSKSDSPDPVAAGGNITYSIGVTNVGDQAASSVSITDTIPANTTFQSLAKPRGVACTTPAVNGTGTVTCSVSSLAVGGSVPLTLVVKVNAGTAGGTVITNTASASGAFTDPTPANNSATATTTVSGGGGTPSISINDVSITETNRGAVTLTFTVTLSAASAQTVTVSFATANGTALAPGDYTAASGVVTFAPGQTSQPVSISVKGDTLDEPNETFFVNLSSPVNATISDSQGQGTIVDND